MFLDASTSRTHFFVIFSQRFCLEDGKLSFCRSFLIVFWFIFLFWSAKKGIIASDRNVLRELTICCKQRHEIGYGSWRSEHKWVQETVPPQLSKASAAHHQVIHLFLCSISISSWFDGFRLQFDAKVAIFLNLIS